MTNEEILKKAIEKAILNGSSGYEKIIGNSPAWDEAVKPKYSFPILFNHDFAKAFFGNEKNVEVDSTTQGEPVYFIDQIWKYRIMELALLKEKYRIKYLEKFL